MSAESIDYIEVAQQKVAVLTCSALSRLTELKQQGFSGAVIVVDEPVDTATILPSINKLGGSSKVAAIYLPQEKALILSAQIWNTLTSTIAASTDQIKTALISMRKFVVVSYKI